MIIQAVIQKWGNSLALRLSGPVRAIPDFKENMLVQIDIQTGGIHVSPVSLKKKLALFKEKDLLKGLSNYTAHGDELAVLSPTEFGN